MAQANGSMDKIDTPQWFSTLISPVASMESLYRKRVARSTRIELRGVVR